MPFSVMDLFDDVPPVLSFHARPHPLYLFVSQYVFSGLCLTSSLAFLSLYPLVYVDGLAPR